VNVTACSFQPQRFTTGCIEKKVPEEVNVIDYSEPIN